MSVKEFKNFILSVYNHLQLGGSTTIPEGSTLEASASGSGKLLIEDEDIV